jgi:DNA-binding protein HU-beta
VEQNPELVLPRTEHLRLLPRADSFLTATLQGTVSLVVLVRLPVTERPARAGPGCTGEIKIKAAKVPRFHLGRGLKDALN